MRIKSSLLAMAVVAAFGLATEARAALLFTFSSAAVVPAGGVDVQPTTTVTYSGNAGGTDADGTGSDIKVSFIDLSSPTGIGAVASPFTFDITITDLTTGAIGVFTLSGSLSGRGWQEVQPALWALCVLGPVAIVLTTTLRALQLGDDSARGLGVRLQRAQAAILVVAVTLAACAVSAAGPIDFVAFVVPQIALRNGAQVVHINPQSVDTGSPREHGLQGAAGVLLPQLVRAAFAG